MKYNDIYCIIYNIMTCFTNNMRYNGIEWDIRVPLQQSNTWDFPARHVCFVEGSHCVFGTSLFCFDRFERWGNQSFKTCF